MSNVPAPERGLAGSLALVERWADHEHTRVGAVTVLKRHKALMGLARRLGRRTLAQATVVDVEAWLATVAPRTQETYATALRSFYRWTVAEQIVSPGADPSRAVRRRVVSVFEPNAELVAAWKVGMERRGLAPSTIEKRRMELRLLQTWIGPDRSPLDVTADELEKWLDSRHLSSNSRRDAISGVHSMFTWAVKMRMVECDPTLAIDRPKVVVHMARPMPDADLKLALERATGEIRCWLLLGAYAGLRCQEIAGIDRRDVMEHETPPILLVRKGKGRKERIVPLHPEIIEALKWCGLPQSGPLFTAGPGQRHRAISPGRLSQRGNKWLHDQGIEATMHQLRHWFGTHTYRASLDLRMTQELLGHSSPNTTTIYAAWNPGAAAGVVQGPVGGHAMSAEGDAWPGRAVDLGRRLGLLEVYIREHGLTPVQAPAIPGSQDGKLASTTIAGGEPALSGIERKWELLEHYVAVLEQRRERAELVAQGEDPGPRLRLVIGGRTS